MLRHADREATEEVDEGDDHAGLGLTTDEPAGTVHAGEEIGLTLQVEPHLPRLVAGDRAGLHLRVDRHLPARQAVEREAGSHLAGPRRTGGDHDELDHRDDREDHAAHDDVVGGHEFTEGLHHLPGSGVAIDGRTRQHQPRGGDVEHQPHERSAEQKRGEDAEFQRGAGGQRPQQGEHRHGQIRRQQHVNDRGRHRREDYHHRQQDDRRNGVVEAAGRGGPGDCRECGWGLRHETTNTGGSRTGRPGLGYEACR